MISFLTEHAFNYAKSRSVSNVAVELKETDFIESLVHLFSEKIVTQMYNEFKQLYVSWPDFDTFSTNLKKKLSVRDFEIDKLAEQLELKSKAATEPVVEAQGPSKMEVEMMI